MRMRRVRAHSIARWYALVFVPVCGYLCVLLCVFTYLCAVSKQITPQLSARPPSRSNRSMVHAWYVYADLNGFVVSVYVFMIVISPHLLRHWLRLNGDKWSSVMYGSVDQLKQTAKLAYASSTLMACEHYLDNMNDFFLYFACV